MLLGYILSSTIYDLDDFILHLLVLFGLKLYFFSINFFLNFIGFINFEICVYKSYTYRITK